MTIALEIEPTAGEPSPVEYRWDADTDILTASMRSADPGTGLSGTVGLEGTDGAWVNIDVTGGRIQGIEVAIWPDVRTDPALVPPLRVENARVSIPARHARELASIEVDTPLAAVTDQAERVIHFTLGAARSVRTLRLATDILLDVDRRGHIAGLWFLNVPPFPAAS